MYEVISMFILICVCGFIMKIIIKIFFDWLEKLGKY